MHHDILFIYGGYFQAQLFLYKSLIKTADKPRVLPYNQNPFGLVYFTLTYYELWWLFVQEKHPHGSPGVTPHAWC